VLAVIAQRSFGARDVRECDRKEICMADKTDQTVKAGPASEHGGKMNKRERAQNATQALTV